MVNRLQLEDLTPRDLKSQPSADALVTPTAITPAFLPKYPPIKQSSPTISSMTGWPSEITADGMEEDLATATARSPIHDPSSSPQHGYAAAPHSAPGSSAATASENTMYGGPYSRYLAIHNLDHLPDSGLVNLSVNQLRHILTQARLHHGSRPYDGGVGTANGGMANATDATASSPFPPSPGHIAQSSGGTEPSAMQTHNPAIGDPTLAGAGTSRKSDRDLAHAIEETLTSLRKEFIWLEQSVSASLLAYDQEVVEIARAIAYKVVNHLHQHFPFELVSDFIRKELGSCYDAESRPVRIEVSPIVHAFINEQLDFDPPINVVANELIEPGNCKIVWAGGFVLKDKNLLLTKLDGILSHYTSSANIPSIKEKSAEMAISTVPAIDVAP